MRKRIVLTGLLLLSAATTAQASVLDNFNRADGPLGPNWTDNVDGTCAIVSNQATCGNLGTTLFNGATGTTIAADVYHNGSSDDFAALVLGYADPTDSLYIKVQSQDSTQGFEWIGLYFGDNGQGGFHWSGSSFLPLSTPFDAAHMVVSLTGSTVTVTIDTNFDTIPDQTYVAGSVPVALLGNGVGIGGWTMSGLSGATIDNFEANGIPVHVPEPISLALAGAGLAGVAGLRRRRKA